MIDPGQLADRKEANAMMAEVMASWKRLADAQRHFAGSVKDPTARMTVVIRCNVALEALFNIRHELQKLLR